LKNKPAGPTRPEPLEGCTFGRQHSCCADLPLATPAAATGSCWRRRRLWELGSAAHCPIIGVCLPITAMRCLAGEVLSGELFAHDCELHCGMVADCKHPPRRAEAVPRDLDRGPMLPLWRAAANRGRPLADPAVLCVGARRASVAPSHRVVEGQLARSLHHDGGERHSASQRESALAAADLVNGQVGCLSENTYRRVKDRRKRTGKHCVFVETPSRAALDRALAHAVQAP
jgi:hypothetical protein